MYGPAAVGCGEWYVYDSVSGVEGPGADGIWVAIMGGMTAAWKKTNVPPIATRSLFTRCLALLFVQLQRST